VEEIPKVSGIVAINLTREGWAYVPHRVQSVQRVSCAAGELSDLAKPLLSLHPR
jgi:hypothetical protein